MIQTNSMQNSFQSFETPAVTDPVRVHDSALACLSVVMMLDCTAGHFINGIRKKQGTNCCF